jgi:hypothetical protein
MSNKNLKRIKMNQNTEKQLNKELDRVIAEEKKRGKKVPLLIAHIQSFLKLCNISKSKEEIEDMVEKRKEELA